MRNKQLVKQIGRGDLVMPNGSGADLVAWVRLCHPHLLGRVGLVTGGAIQPAEDAFLTRGELQCLAKPFEINQLHAFVASLEHEP